MLVAHSIEQQPEYQPEYKQGLEPRTFHLFLLTLSIWPLTRPRSTSVRLGPLRNARAPANWRKRYPTGDKVDRWSDFEYVAPSVIMQFSGGVNAGDFDQGTVETERLRQHRCPSHLLALVERVRGITPLATRVAHRSADEHARQPGEGRFALDAAVDLVDDQRPRRLVGQGPEALGMEGRRGAGRDFFGNKFLSQ